MLSTYDGAKHTCETLSKKNNKYEYNRVLQQKTEQGWEDICEYPSNSYYKCAKHIQKEIRDDLIAYRTNQSEYEYRVINRRAQL